MWLPKEELHLERCPAVLAKPAVVATSSEELLRADAGYEPSTLTEDPNALPVSMATFIGATAAVILGVSLPVHKH
jgi:hypothetical protein